MENLREKSLELAKNIEKTYKPDLVVFVAKGSYIIGEEISKHFNTPLVEVYATREGNKIKNILSPFIKLVPRDLKNYLRKKEVKSGIHDKNTKRRVYFKKEYKELMLSKNILIVDDSVDTGHTAKQVYEHIKEKYENKKIKFASLNYFKKSEELFKVDYCLHENYIMIGPWSKDSKYYKEFLTRYNLAKKKGVI